MLVIAKGIGDSENKRASFVCLFLDGRDGLGEGTGAERPRKKGKIYLNCMPSKSRPYGRRFCCYRCSTLFNYYRYSCIGAFFDLIEWLKVFCLDL